MSETIGSDRSFYRQSIWMIFATTTANIFSFGVNLVAPWMTMAEYGLMAALLQFSTLMMIPSMGLQAVFAVEGASTDSLKEDYELAQKAITGLFLTSLLWIIFAGLAFHFRAEIFRELSISHPLAFWVTVCLGLPQLWLPILMGLLQGRQKFLGLGWALIANGVGRFSAVIFIIVILGGQAAGGMTGILLGSSAALTVCVWHTRSIWLRKFSGFKWRSWNGQILSLTFGLGAVQFMMSADMIFARSYFEARQAFMPSRVFLRGDSLS